MEAGAFPVSLRRLLGRWGPASDPPAEVVRHVSRLVRARAGAALGQVLRGEPVGLARLSQLVAAYGLGWCRQLRFTEWESRPCGWGGVWDRAADWLLGVVYKGMLGASRFLEFGLGVEGYAFRRHPELTRGVAQTLAVWLITGTCRCSRLPLGHSSAGAGLANCLRRMARCLRQHSIVGWDPERASLSDFVFQAVKGARTPKRRHFAPKALVQGMHYWNLHHLSHIHFADVLVWVCGADGSRNFEGLPCLQCRDEGRGGAVDPLAFRTVLRRLIVPKQYDGRYYPTAYWHCQHCGKNGCADHPNFPGGHYYPEERRSCPWCGKPRGAGARRSQVYLLAPRGAARLMALPSPSDLDFDAVEEESADSAPLGSVGPGEGEPEPFAESESTREPLRPARSAIPPAAVEAAVAGLDRSEQGLVRLMFWEKLTLPEAALRLGLTSHAAKELQTAALKKLETALDAKPEESEDDDDEYD
ncbi:MAG TPA: hypothetical protein VN829_22720 [Dongiaceae bacterium]|nr:hypothetical protein [Dongiaceae bacterium]